MKRSLFGGLAALALLGAFAAGLITGSAMDVLDAVFGQEDVEIREVIDLYGKTRSEKVSFDHYWHVWDKIQDKYAGGDADDVSLFYGSMQGLVKSLDDPYSVFLPPQQAEDFADGLSGAFEGIGAEIGMRDEVLTVIAPLPETPAMRAGLKALDVILAIDGDDTEGITVEEAVTKIRGPKGTEVALGVLRESTSEVLDIVITRDTIDIPVVSVEIADEEKEREIDTKGFEYIRVAYLNEQTWEQFDKQVKEIVLSSPEGIIFDLRSNPGGFLGTAVSIASEWIPEGVILTERLVDDQVREYSAEGNARLSNMRTVVLVDGGSASGAEIIAGALQDYDKATVVGEQTFGKGSVQDFEVLPDGSALKLTIAKWFTPEGRQITDEGITPDAILEEMFTQKEGTDGSSPEHFIDNGLEKAIQILEGQSI